jgi:competence protein ComEC
MTAAIYFRPGIPLLISLICGIVLGSAYKGGEFGAGTVLVVTAAWIGRQVYCRRGGAIFPMLFFAALGYLSIAPWVHPRFPANHVIHYAGSQRWEITGKIDSKPQHTRNRVRLILQVTSLGDEHQKTHAVSGKLRLTAVGNLPPFSVGDVLRLNSRIRLITNFNNPGGFDYRRYMAFKGIWATAYVRADRLEVIEQHPTTGLLTYISRVRKSFSDLVDRSGDGAAGAVFKALVIGDRTQISPQMRQAFNRAGVGHLLAISGLHIGIVATVAFVLFQALMVRIRPLLWRAATRKAAALFSLLPVLFYGLIAGLSPSTQRAVIMVAIFLLTFLFESEQDPLNTLALAALLILAADPPSLFSISFQLSFSAVFAIICGFSSIQNRRGPKKIWPKERWYSRFRRRLISFFLVSLFAICGSLPLVSYYFNQISLVGLAANFIAVPLIGFVTIPLGLLALCVLPLSMTLALWCIKLGTLILSWALEAVNFFADLPFAAVKTVTPSILEIACFYSLGWALLNLPLFGRSALTTPQTAPGAADRNSSKDRPDDPAHAGHTGLRQFAAICAQLRDRALAPGQLAKITMALVLLILALDAGYWSYQRFWHRDLRVTVIDVGLGSASLLELPGGHTILIDGGGFADNAGFDVGQRIIAPLLWRKKIRSVDTLILSHPNSDHLNGLIYIAQHFNVKSVWTNNESRNTLGYAKFMDVIAHQKIHLPVFEKMPRRQRIGGVELGVLYPPPNYLKLRDTQSWRNTNNNSLVVKASFKSISFLFPGDIMARAEAELVQLAGNRLSSTVMVAPHHGSKTSSSQVFLNAVDPEVVIISSARNNRFKFPHQVIIKRYENQRCTIWRTDISGAIRLATDGQHLQIQGTVGSGLQN